MGKTSLAADLLEKYGPEADRAVVDSGVLKKGADAVSDMDKAVDGAQQLAPLDNTGPSADMSLFGQAKSLGEPLIAGAHTISQAVSPTVSRIVNAYNGSPLAPVVNAGVNAYHTVADPLNAVRQQFIDNSANQMNFTKNSVNPKGNPEVTDAGKVAFDLALPAPADALMMGAGKLAGMAPGLAAKIADGASEFNKLGTLGNEVGSVGKNVRPVAAQIYEDAKAAGKVPVIQTAQEALEAKQQAQFQQKAQEYLDRQQFIRDTRKAKLGQ